MAEDDLFDALDGLIAYDEGSTDSGIHDEDLRARCITGILALDTTAQNALISRWIRTWLTDEALAQGYSWEDAKSACDWMEEQLAAFVR